MKERRKKNCPECQFENGKHSFECSRYEYSSLDSMKKKKQTTKKVLVKNQINPKDNGVCVMGAPVVVGDKKYFIPYEENNTLNPPHSPYLQFCYCKECKDYWRMWIIKQFA